MGILFGKSKKPQSRVTEHDRAVLVRYEIFVTMIQCLYDSSGNVGTTLGLNYFVSLFSGRKL
jgi:hypothetical protein